MVLSETDFFGNIEIEAEEGFVLCHVYELLIFDFLTGVAKKGAAKSLFCVKKVT